MVYIKHKLISCFERTIHYHVKLLKYGSVFIIGILLFSSLLLGSGLRLWYAQQADDVEYLYTPANGRFVSERQSSFDLWPLDPERFVPGRTFDLKTATTMILTLKNNSNMLKLSYLDEISEWNDYVVKKMYTSYPDKNTAYQFKDLCLKFQSKCSFTNQHLFLLKAAVKHCKTGELTFPRLEIFRGNAPIYLGYLIGGVDLKPDQYHIESIHAIFLVYYLRFDNKFATVSKRWEAEFEHRIMERFQNNQSSIFDISYWHSNSLKYAMEQETIVVSCPKTMELVIILTCMTWIISTNFVKSDGLWNLDFVNTKPILAICGLMSALFANITAVGTWGYAGGIFCGSIQVTTFISIAVGLDDMFIINRAWSQSNVHSSVSDRMAFTLKYAVHSITITSLTSCLSFAIGSTSSYNGIAIFCVVMAFNMAVNYFYMITLYAACVYLSGVIEHLGLHRSLLYFLSKSSNKGTYGLVINGYGSVLPLQNGFIKGATVHSGVDQNGNGNENLNKTDAKPQTTNKSSFVIVNKLENNSIKKNSLSKAYHNIISIKWKEGNQIENNVSTLYSRDPFAAFIYKYYCGWLLTTPVRIIVAILYCVYIYIAICGIAQMKVGKDVRELFPPKNHATKFYRTIYDRFFEKGQQIELIVHRAPALESRVNREKLHDMVESLENTHNTMSKNATDFFLRDYENYLNVTNSSMQDDPLIWEANLLKWSTLSTVKANVEKDMKWIPIPGTLKSCPQCVSKLTAFRFRIGLKNFNTIDGQKSVLKVIRNLVRKYPEYNLTTYHQDWPWVEQYHTLAKTACLAIFYTILCMFAVSVVFFRNAYCVVWTILAILSIDIGTLGFMSLVHVNLDFASVTVVIISIGLSVDYTAHIVHGFQVARGDAGEKIRTALASLGWPVLQGALTSFAGVSILLTNPFYISLVFGVVVSLSIFFGMLHACIFLPTVLCMSFEIIDKITKKCDNQCGI